MAEQSLIGENKVDLHAENKSTLPVSSAELPAIEEKLSSEATPQIKKTESSKEIELTLENSRAFGNFYTSMTHSLMGEGEIKDASSFGLDEKTQQLGQNMTAAIDTERSMQHDWMEMKSWGAKELLEQIRGDGKAGEMLADKSRYRMQEFSKGVYGVFVDPDMYDEFAPRESQAVAAKVRTEEGISFVIIKEFREEQHEQFNEQQLKENIPHEINHLACFFLERQGAIATEEQHPEEQKAFSIYREELVSRLVSDGGMGGYSHLSIMSKESREQITAKYPEVVSKIDNEVSTANDYLQEMLEPQRTKTDVRKQDMLLAVVEAKTFLGLKDNLNKMEEIIKTRPIKDVPLEPITSGGWGSV